MMISRNRFHSKRRSVSASSTEPILKINNRLGNFAVGILQGLANNETGWKNCLPAEWMHPEKVEEDENTKEFQKTGNIFTKVWDIVKTILKFVCPITKILKIIINLTEIFFVGDVISFVEGRFRKRNRRGIRDRLFKLKAHLKEKRNSLTTHVQDTFEKLENHLIEFKNRIVALYNSEAFQKFINILVCLKRAG